MTDFGASWNGVPFPPPLDIAALFSPYPPLRVVTVPELATRRVYQERERFSGGVNLSAQARNAARREEAKAKDLTTYVDQELGNVYCAPAAAELLRKRCPEIPHGPPAMRPISFALAPISFEQLNEPESDVSWLAYHRVQRDAGRAIDSLLIRYIAEEESK